MSLRPIASLATKLLGLYAVINALPSLGYLALSLQVSSSPPPYVSPDPRLIAFFNILPGVIQMLVGIGLWFFSDGISYSMIKNEGDGPVPSSSGWAEMVFAAVGAFVLVEFTVELTRFAVNVWAVSQTGSLLRPEQAHIGAPDFLPILVRGGLGLWLLLGSRRLVSGVANLKNVGRDLE